MQEGENLVPSASAEHTRKKSSGKRVLTILLGGILIISIAVAGGFALNSLRISNLIASIDSALDSGNSSEAQVKLTELMESDPDNELLPELEERVEYALKLDAYERALLEDDLETALRELIDANEISPSSELEAKLAEARRLIDSKSSFQAGNEALRSGNYLSAFESLNSVSADDKLRYEEAQRLAKDASRLYLEDSLLAVKAQLESRPLFAFRQANDVLKLFPEAREFIQVRDSAALSHAENTRQSAEALVQKGFYISAYRLVDGATSALGLNSQPAKDLNAWFNPILERAKKNALQNEVVARKDSFSGAVDYYYKGTYRTCCGGFLQAADRFMLILAGSSNPQLFVNVMLYQDDWVFAKSIQANIDGTIWTIVTDSFFGDSIQRDNAYGNIWEYTTKRATAQDITFFIQARESDRTVIRFQGDRNRGDFVVTPTMKRGIEQMLLAYLELGGSKSLILG